MATMEKKVYETPSMKFEELQLSDDIAAQCWSPNGSDTYAGTYYLDTPGLGYVEFEAKTNDKNCGQAEIRVLGYYNFPDESKYPTEAQILKYVKDYCGGNSGNPFSASEHVTPDDPKDIWS